MSQPRLLVTDRVIRIVADDKIRAAISQGEFDNLSGIGKTHAIFEEDYDQQWWIRRKLADEGIRVVGDRWMLKNAKAS